MYMAPEQHLPHEKVDERADLYALGVICLELLTGSYPFAAASHSFHGLYQAKMDFSSQDVLPVYLRFSFTVLLAEANCAQG